MLSFKWLVAWANIHMGKFIRIFIMSGFLKVCVRILRWFKVKT